MPARTLTGSFLVATFFNNFLPSNIGGDVIRIADSAKPARSKTLATTVVLIDRGLGLLGLILLAAIAASAAHTEGVPAGPVPARAALDRVRRRHRRRGACGCLAGAAGARAGAAPPPPSRMGGREARTIVGRAEPLSGGASGARRLLHRCRARPGAPGRRFTRPLHRRLACGCRPGTWRSSCPVSFLVQMLPVSLNGFGLREATFSFYFARLGLPIEAALVISLLGAGLVMLFSLSGAAVYVVRGT